VAQDRLLTPAEVSTRLGLGRTKTYDLIARKVLPVVELGPRTKRVPEQALEKWIDERTRMVEDP
jgi:excisionase family DNA binding protein